MYGLMYIYYYFNIAILHLSYPILVGINILMVYAYLSIQAERGQRGSQNAWHHYCKKLKVLVQLEVRQNRKKKLSCYTV